MDTSILVSGGQNRKLSGPHSWVVVLSSAGYYAGAMIGILLTVQHFPISFFWLSNAILLAALLALPVRIWWMVLIAALPAHLATSVSSGVPIGMVLCWFISNCCQALLGAAAVRGMLGRRVRLRYFRDMVVFIIFCAFVAPFASSIL